MSDCLAFLVSRHRKFASWFISLDVSKERKSLFQIQDQKEEKVREECNIAVQVLLNSSDTESTESGREACLLQSYTFSDTHDDTSSSRIDPILQTKIPVDVAEDIMTMAKVPLDVGLVARKSKRRFACFRTKDAEKCFYVRVAHKCLA